MWGRRIKWSRAREWATSLTIHAVGHLHRLRTSLPMQAGRKPHNPCSWLRVKHKSMLQMGVGIAVKELPKGVWDEWVK